MPQSTKDSAGGKSHASQKKHTGSQPGANSEGKKTSPNSPTGPIKRGEKKTTP